MKNLTFLVLTACLLVSSVAGVRVFKVHFPNHSNNFFRFQNLDYDGWLTVQLFHSLDLKNPEVFTNRGNISVTSINTSQLKISQRSLNEEEKLSLITLANAGKFYRIKAIVTGNDGSTTTFLTSAKAVRFLEFYRKSCN